MLENLIQLVKQYAGDSILNNPAIPNEHHEAIIAEAGNSITQGLQGLISQGKIQDLVNMFHNNPGTLNESPALQNISGNFVQTLMDKFGLNATTARAASSGLIPAVLQNLVKKTNDPADNSFSLEGILAHLGAKQGIESLLGSRDGDGNAGILDKVKGLFA